MSTNHGHTCTQLKVKDVDSFVLPSRTNAAVQLLIVQNLLLFSLDSLPAFHPSLENPSPSLSFSSDTLLDHEPFDEAQYIPPGDARTTYRQNCKLERKHDCHVGFIK